jgi:hypothetical protein
MAHKPIFLCQLFVKFCDFNIFLLILIVFLQALVGFKTTFAACPSANFIIGRGFPSGSNNSGSTVGDFNNDGKVDVAVINSLGFNSVIAVTLGNGDGTFQAPITTPMEPNGVRLATGDFNQDNKLDLAVALSSAGAVGIMLGNGNGTFGFTDLYTAQPGTSRLAVKDFNGDGRLDIAASNFSTQSFSIFFGNANGTFGNATNYTNIPQIGGIASADFDQDGDNDLVIAYGDNDIFNPGTRFQYRQNNGSGTFSFVSERTNLLTFKAEIVADDINGDSVPDVILGGSWLNDLAQRVARLYAFRTQISGGQVSFVTTGERIWGLTLQTVVTDIAINDVNGDGQKDIVAPNFYNGNVSVIVTGANGTLGPSVNYYAGNGPQNVHLGDLNNDAKPDIIVSNTSANQFNVLMNRGLGRFAGASSISTVTWTQGNEGGSGSGSENGAIFFANINNDSFLDVFQYTAVGAYGEPVCSALGNIVGTFNSQCISGFTNNQVVFLAGTIGDFNNDGINDFLNGTFGGFDPPAFLRPMLGNGNGGFTSTETYFQLPGLPTWVVAGDFNNDARLDAVAAIRDTNQIAFLRGNGQASFNTAVMTSVGTQPVYAVAFDFNSDSNLDLATANRGSSNVSVLLGNGNGTFAAAVNYPVGTNPKHISLADVNGDGRADILTANSGSANVSILPGNADGTFGLGNSVTVGNSAYSTAVADYNNDGLLDIATANRGSASNSISINMGTGSGTFGQPSHITYGMHEPVWVLARDVNFDSRPDLIVAHRLSNQLNVLVNSCEAFNFTRRVHLDFDGDGRSDQAVYRSSEGNWYINRSSFGFQARSWGLSSDIPTPADFDGDQIADIAVWRPAPATQAAFYILKSSTNTVGIEAFGQTGDNPALVADYDGDGKADPAVYREGSQSNFFFRGSLNNPNGNTTYIPWGTTGDKPASGDYNGDGKNDFAIYRNGQWWILQIGSAAVQVLNWGIAGDKLVQADYDGDGKTDLAVFRPSDGNWYILQSSNNQPKYQQWGLSSDVLVPADYDGDGKTDTAIFRNGNWYVLLSSRGSIQYAYFGLSTDTPVASAFVQ